MDQRAARMMSAEGVGQMKLVLRKRIHGCDSTHNCRGDFEIRDENTGENP
jgi:hypothetical protein